MTVTGLGQTVYTLEKTHIGSGGEGEVYAARGTNQVAKIYREGFLTAELEGKLRIMIDNPPKESVLSQVAWPLDLVYGERGQCLGFIMPRLNITHELGEIYKYPPALSLTTRQKMNIAQNICVVISEVHKAGYVFGDFNPRNIGIDINTGLVSFLDTDTYHVQDLANRRTHRCNVCAPGYAAPELLDRVSDYVAENPTASKNAYATTPLPTFTKETDNFALAIHIFKLLMNGYTPFGGILETAVVSQASPGVGDTAVRRDNYCFKPGFKHQSVAIMPLETLPQEVAELFTRAFINGKRDPKQRPDAVEWHGVLSSYIKNLVNCRENTLHQYYGKNANCPLCEADKRFADAVSWSAPQALTQSAYAAAPKPVMQSPLTSSSIQGNQPTYRIASAVQQSQPQAPSSSTKGSTAPQPTNSQREPWHYMLVGAASILVVVAVILHAAIPGGLGSLFSPTQTNFNFESPHGFVAPTPTPIPTPTPTPTPEPTPAPEPAIQTVYIGEIIPFGGHNWRVLDVWGNSALIITENIIGHRMFHNSLSSVTWETSEIRQFLNGTFLYTFPESDRQRVLETVVINNSNPWDFTDWGGNARTSGGNDTIDRVFLLSIDEVLWYFGDSGLVAEGAARGVGVRNRYAPRMPAWGVYAWGIHDQFSEARIARDSAGTATWWWLRTPGHSHSRAADVRFDGLLGISGPLVFEAGSIGGGVRPALWLNLE